MVGGKDNSGKFRTELERLPNLTSSHFLERAPIPSVEGLSGSCMVSLNDDTLMLMGGFVSGLTITNNAWTYHISNNTWNTAHSMNTGRAHHSCSVMKATPQESAKVIVVGGSIDDDWVGVEREAGLV